MSKLYSSKEIEYVLKKLKFSFVNQRGSHGKYKNIEGKIVILPMNKKEIPFGTFRSILRQIGINLKDFELILSGLKKGEKMKYENMFPEQIRQAIEKNIPVVLPVGVIEYHSEHLPVGVDTLLVLKALEEIEKEIDIIILPPFFYGCASYAVEPPESKGTIHIKAEIVYRFAKGLFENLLRIGFRNIYVFIHHQSENFISGMPTDLAFKLAGKEVIFEFLEKKYGEGWWGKEESQNYYKEHEKGIDPFNWIKILPFMDEETQKKYPIDHAGKQETSLMMAFCPEVVDMKKFKKEKWYSRSAISASKEYGEKAKEEIIKSLKKILKGEIKC